MLFGRPDFEYKTATIFELYLCTSEYKPTIDAISDDSFSPIELANFYKAKGIRITGKARYLIEENVPYNIAELSYNKNRR